MTQFVSEPHLPPKTAKLIRFNPVRFGGSCLRFSAPLSPILVETFSKEKEKKRTFPCPGAATHPPTGHPRARACDRKIAQPIKSLICQLGTILTNHETPSQSFRKPKHSVGGAWTNPEDRFKTFNILFILQSERIKSKKFKKETEKKTTKLFNKTGIKVFTEIRDFGQHLTSF